MITPARDIADRVKVLDWERASKDLDAQGCAMIEGVITREECDALAKLYPVDGRFRSRVVMERHGFIRWLHHSYIWSNLGFKDFDPSLAVFHANQRRSQDHAEAWT